MIPSIFRTILVVTRKELGEHFKTMRLIIISIIFAAVFFIIMLFGHYIVGGDVPVYERGPNETLAILLSFSSLFPPILAMALGYDSIVGERTRRSLHLLLSKPVDRSSIYIGKFLGAFLSIAIIYLSVCTIGYIIVIGLSGIVPSSAEVGGAYGGMGIIMMSSAIWILFVMLFSTSFKTVTSTIIFSFIFWFLILNLLSLSGLIYYSVINSTDDEPITVDMVPLENSLYFYSHRINQTITTVEVELTYEEIRIIDAPTSGGVELPIFPLAELEYGNYSWMAVYIPDSSNNREVISKGEFYYSSDFVPFVSMANHDHDDHIDDLTLSVGGGTQNFNLRYNLTIIKEDDDLIIVQETNNRGLYTQKNLDEGDYRVKITMNNDTYLNTTIHSYGELESKGGFMSFGSDEDVEYPDYVKITFASNPDNAASIGFNVITGEESSGILTTQEGLIALALEFFLLISLGLLIFSKIELL